MAIEIQTTHVGSLIRPDTLVALLRRQWEGEAVDAGELSDALDAGVAELVAKQASIGLDLLSDGECGKNLSWSQYVMERLAGFEFRPQEVASAAKAIGGKDRRDFAEFYEEYEGALGVAGMGKGAMPQGDWAVIGPISYSGSDIVAADIERFQRALSTADVAGGFLPVVSPSSVVPARIDEHYDSQEEALFAIAEALRTEYRAIVDAGLILQIDDAYLASTFARHGPTRNARRLPAVGRGPGRGGQPCACGPARGSHPLSRLLGELERPAFERCAGQRHHRPRVEGASRGLSAGNGKPSP